MKLVAGLGNPGKKYSTTRHNLGFRVVEELARRQNSVFRNEGEFLTAEVEFGENCALLIKPMSFMNESGRAIGVLLRHSECGLENLLVVCDDVWLPMGKLRLRRRGSHGGHKGLKSVIETLGTEEFPRLRVGIGPPPANLELTEFVLSPFGGEERDVIEEAIVRAGDAVEHWAEEGIETTMMRFN